MASNSIRSSEQRRVGLIYDERMRKHFDPVDELHPECPDRIRDIWKKLRSSGIAQKYISIFLSFDIILDNNRLIFNFLVQMYCYGWNGSEG